MPNNFYTIMTIYNSFNELIVNKITSISPVLNELDFPHFILNFLFYAD